MYNTCRLIFFRLTIFILVPFFITSCLTYYQKNSDFQNRFERGQIEEAEKVLAKIKEKHLRKTLIIQKFNQGVISSLLGKYEESNRFFEEAYLIGEDYQRNYASEAASFLLNPNLVVYKPESHELMMIHYFKAVNYLKMGLSDEALVEAKRMNIKLQQFSDKYTSDKKLKEDAFAHNLMGIIYQANGDYNNAFIAYRNAYNVYQNEYADFFNLHAPEQLKQDLLNAAHRTGLHDEVTFYEKQFGSKFKLSDVKGKGEAILFWNDGLGPVKGQTAINFVLVRGQAGMFYFQNDELGLSFPFFISDSDYQSQGFADLNIFRVVFPKYMERPLAYSSATLNVAGTASQLQLAQDVNQIAFKSLKDRMLTEMGKSLLRFASKKALEYQVRKQNQNVGALLGVFDALTENADTRNWQTLPHSVFYTRVLLPEGTHNSTLQTSGQSGNKSVSLTLDIRSGKTSFYTYNTLDYTKLPQ